MSITLSKKTALSNLLIILLALSCLFAAVKAPGQNAIQNPGFEDSTDWEAFYSSFQGSYAQVQDSTYKYNGNYSVLILDRKSIKSELEKFIRTL